MIEKIAKSDYGNSYKYLKAFQNYLDRFDLEDSIKFWEELRLELVLELLREKSNNFELFFDYLMPDWHCPHTIEAFDYNLSKKIERFNEANDFTTNDRKSSNTVFLEYVFFIIDYDHKFQNVCFRLLCQFLHEIMQNPKQDDLSKILLELLERTSTAKTPELKTNLFEVILSVFIVLKHSMHINSEEAAVIRSKIDQFETSRFKELADQLEKQQVVVFHESFNKFIEESIESYCDYSNAAMAHHVRLLVFIANNLNLTLTVDVITRKFPFVGKNVTILTTLDELQMFNNFKIGPISGKLSELVSKCI